MDESVPVCQIELDVYWMMYDTVICFGFYCFFYKLCSVIVFIGIGDGGGGAAHPLPQRHSRGWLQQRQVRETVGKRTNVGLYLD